jgi:hypothetical protein
MSETFPRKKYYGNDKFPLADIIGRKEHIVESRTNQLPNEVPSGAAPPRFSMNLNLIGEQVASPNPKKSSQYSKNKLFQSDVISVKEKPKKQDQFQRKTPNPNNQGLEFINAEFPPIFSKIHPRNKAGDLDPRNRHSMELNPKNVKMSKENNSSYKKQIDSKIKHLYEPNITQNDPFDKALKSKMANWKSENFNKTNKEQKLDFSKMGIRYKIIGGLSQGVKKVCQDNILITDFQVENTQFLVMAVFDGHGRLGERLSGFLKANMEYYLKSEIEMSSINVENIKKALENTVYCLHNEISKISTNQTSNV